MSDEAAIQPTRRSSKSARVSPRVPPTPNAHKALNLVMRMMAIEGKSGQEGRIVRYITSLLRRAGVPDEWVFTDTANERTPIRGDTGNLILKLPGSSSQPRRLFMAHLDTVPICVGSEPVRQGDFVRPSSPDTGLGADDRAGASVLLQTALEIIRNRYDHPPLTFFWTVQEELGLHGARCADIDLLGKPSLAFNWDGGPAEKLTVGATGGYRMRIDVQGLASHAGAAPERGVSAISIAALAIAQLQQEGWLGDVRKEESHGTSNIGAIQGGEGTNVVADRVSIRAEARSHDPSFREEIVGQIERSFQEAAQEVTNCLGECGRVKFEGHLDYEAFQLPADDPSILAAEAAIRTIGGTPQRAITNGGIDANWMATHGIPTVTLGCGQLNQHMTSEALDVAAFQNACRIALCLATATES